MRETTEELRRQQFARAGSAELQQLVVLVHDEPSFLWNGVAALSEAGYEVDVFTDPIVALNEIEAASIEVFVARVAFPRGRPTGVSLASVLRAKYPRMKVIFVDQPEWEKHTTGIGEFIPLPLNVAKLVEAVTRIASN